MPSGVGQGFQSAVSRTSYPPPCRRIVQDRSLQVGPRPLLPLLHALVEEREQGRGGSFLVSNLRSLAFILFNFRPRVSCLLTAENQTPALLPHIPNELP